MNAVFCPNCGSAYVIVYDALDDEWLCTYCGSVTCEDELLTDAAEANTKHQCYATDADVEYVRSERSTTVA